MNREDTNVRYYRSGKTRAGRPEQEGRSTADIPVTTMPDQKAGHYVKDTEGGMTT